MTYLHFIVNPISGNGKHNLSAVVLRNFFPRSAFRVEVDYTQRKGHAVDLTREAMRQAPDCIVACGGDGTINEVAAQLVGSGIKLGIVPVGSGNGLASHLEIPKAIDAALSVIQAGEVTAIDVGSVNGKPFFSNMGIGLDAAIIKRYEKTGKRTLWGYVQATMGVSMSFRPRTTVLSFDDGSLRLDALMVFVSNSNEMGYGMSLTPRASLQDGKLDVAVVPMLSSFAKLMLGYRVLTRRIDQFNSIEHLSATQIRLEQPDSIFLDAQLDGESHNFKTNVLEISVQPAALSVVASLNPKETAMA